MCYDVLLEYAQVADFGFEHLPHVIHAEAVEIVEADGVVVFPVGVRVSDEPGQARTDDFARDEFVC